MPDGTDDFQIEGADDLKQDQVARVRESLKRTLQAELARERLPIEEGIHASSHVNAVSGIKV